MENKEILGVYASDKVTGFSGTIIGVVTYLTGCDQYLVQPKLKDGSFIEARWIDSGRIDIGETVIARSSVMAKENGCDKQAPIK